MHRNATLIPFAQRAALCAGVEFGISFTYFYLLTSFSALPVENTLNYLVFPSFIRTFAT